MPKITLRVPLDQPTLSQKNEVKTSLIGEKGTKESKLSLGSWIAVCAANEICTDIAEY